MRTEPWTDVDDEATVRTHTIRHTHEMSCSSPGEGRINQKRKKNIESAAAFDKEEEGAAVKSH